MVFAGLLDQPDHRSNHATTIPTAGGIGIIAGLGTGMLALAILYPAFAEQSLLGSLMALALGVGLLGLFDDIYDVNARLKFLAILILSCAVVYIIGAPHQFPLVVGNLPIPVWLGFSGAVLWVFVVTNAVNFMDGSNGLMASAMAVSFLALAIIAILVGASATALFCAVMLAALLGFLPYNAGNQARIFSGDVGSLSVGFCFASAALLLLSEAPNFGGLYVGPLLFLPFLTDTLMTMLFRAFRHENLLSPHKSHLYQRMIAAGSSHVEVSILYTVATFFISTLTIMALWLNMINSLFFLALAVCVLAVIYLIVHKKLER